MSLKRANLSILLVAFVLASPLGASWCDAACAAGTSGTHHNAPRPIDHTSMSVAHHAHHAAAAAPTTAYLSGHTQKCATPRLDVAPQVKPVSNAKDQLQTSVSTARGCEAINAGVQTMTVFGSPPDTGPPVLTSLRI